MSDNVLITVFLKHQQDKNLGEINAKLDEGEFWADFPPDGVEVVSWYVMMGIGQVAMAIASLWQLLQEGTGETSH